MLRDIIFKDLKSPSDIFLLQDYLRELYRLVDRSQQTVAYAASITVDASQSQTFFVTLTGNITGITISNADTARRITFIFLQDGTGGRTVAGWPASVLLSGAAFTVTTNANRYSTITFEYCNSKWIEVGRTTDVR